MGLWFNNCALVQLIEVPPFRKENGGTMKDNKRYIYVKGELVEVSEKVFKEYYRPIWRTQNRAKRLGECRCPKQQLWKCDGVCPGCIYYTSKRKVSADTPLDRSGLTLGDTLKSPSTSAEELEESELTYALRRELDKLEPSLKEICVLVAMGKTERQISEITHKSQSTINYQKRKAFKILREKLEKYM